MDLGNKYLQEGHYQEAILAFRKAIEIEPKNIPGRLALSKIYVEENKDYKTAQNYLEEILKIDPNNQEALKFKNDYSRVYDIYPTKSDEEKIALMTFMENFCYNLRSFDINKYNDGDLLWFAFNNDFDGVGSLENDSSWYIKDGPRIKRNIFGFDEELAPRSPQLVDNYIKELFGVVPAKKSGVYS